MWHSCCIWTLVLFRQIENNWYNNWWIKISCKEAFWSVTICLKTFKLSSERTWNQQVNNTKGNNNMVNNYVIVRIHKYWIKLAKIEIYIITYLISLSGYFYVLTEKEDVIWINEEVNNWIKTVFIIFVQMELFTMRNRKVRKM